MSNPAHSPATLIVFIHNTGQTSPHRICSNSSTEYPDATSVSKDVKTTFDNVFNLRRGRTHA